MPIYKTEAIVIRRRNQGESDRVLSLFSPTHGRFSAIAKGGRKTKSKLAGGIELFSKSDYTLSEGRTFEVINEASLKRNFLEGKNIYEINFAHLLAELIIKYIPERLVVENLYYDLDFVLNALGQINTDILEIYFVSKLLKYLGTYPELTVCLECKSKPQKDIYFSPVSGGIFCDQCFKDEIGSMSVEKDTIKLWRFLMDTDNRSLAKLNIEPNTLRETRRLLRLYLINTSGAELRTLGYGN
jgi:DNA repair protein RecO (recombination protein O)